MIKRDDYIRDCEEVRRNIITQLEPLVSGAQRTGEHRFGSTPFDTTQLDILRLRNGLANSDFILAQLLT